MRDFRTGDRSHSLDRQTGQGRGPEPQQQSPDEQAIARAVRLRQDAESAASRAGNLATIIGREAWRTEKVVLDTKRVELEGQIASHLADAATADEAREHLDAAKAQVGELAIVLEKAVEPRAKPPVAGEIDIEPSILDRGAAPDDVLAWAARLSASERRALGERLSAVSGTSRREDTFAVALSNYLGRSRTLTPFRGVLADPRRFDTAAYDRARAARQSDESDADSADPGAASVEPDSTGDAGAHSEVAGALPNDVSAAAVEGAAVQLKAATSDGALTGEQLVNTATDGVAGASAPLPHLDAIQRSFGSHDVTGIRAQVGGDGAAAAGAIGAEAYAVGDRAAFASAPDLHTAAHEAAHTVQQRSGVSLRGGVGEVGDRHEQHADEAADAVVAGRSAEAILDRGAERGTGSEAPSVQRKAGPTLIPAAEYLESNAHDLADGLVRHLRGVPWIQPDLRLPWSRQDAFTAALVEWLGQFLGNFTEPTNLKQLCHPANPLAVIDQLRPTQAAPATGTRLLDNIEPRSGGMVGPADWLPSIGVAIGQLLEGSIVASLRRLGPRWVACADRGMSEDARVDETRSLVAYDALVTSHPIDRIVGRAMTGGAVFAFQEDPARAGKPDAQGGEGQPRAVSLKWQGARDPKLWNWIRAEPADASAEEVAASLFTGSEKQYGERTTFLAYLLTAAPPLFGVAPATALRFREAEDHAPADGKDGGPDERVMAVASGPAAGEIALHQGADEVLPTVGEGGPKATLRDLVSGNQLQLQYLIGTLAPWDLAEPVGHALGFILGKQGELMTSADADLAAWARVFTAQRTNLQRVGAGVRQVTDKAREMGLADPTARDAAPLRDILAVYARAAGTSHLVDTSSALIDEAAAKQAGLALLAVQGSSRGLDVALDQLRAGTGSDDPLRTGYIQQGNELQEQSTALQSRLLAGEAVPAEELEQVTLRADILALRARVRTASTQLDSLEQAAHAAGKGLAQELAAGMSSDFRGIEGTCAGMRAVINLALTQMDHEMAPPSTLPGMPVGGADRRRQQVYDAGPHDARQSLQTADAKFREIAGNEEFVKFLRHGASLVQWQGFRTACVQVAALVGISIVAGVAGGIVGDAIGGMMMRAGAVESIAELSLGARVIAGTANIAADSAINAAGQNAIMGQSLGEAFLENMIVTVGASAILGTLAANAEKVARVEAATAGVWQKVKGAGKLVLTEGAAITGHAVMGAALGYASHMMVTGKTQPPPETAREWFLQGASITVGRYVGQGIHARINGLRKVRHANPLGERLFKRAQELLKLAEAVESKPEAFEALELLNKRHEMLVEELRMLDSLLQDETARGKAELSRHDIYEMKAELETQLGDAHASGGADISFHLAGLEELVPGAVWRGTPEDIDRAVKSATRQSEGTDRKVQATRDEITGKWDVTIDGRRIEIHERAPVGATGARSATLDPAVDAALAAPPQLQARIDQVAGVEKGPAYDQAQAELRRFYTDMGGEAQQVKKVQGTVTDGKYGWTHGHDVQQFSHGLANVVLRIHLDAGTVPPADLAHLKQQITFGVDQHYNFQHDVGGRRLHLEVEFVDAPAEAHLRVSVHPGDGPADLENWFAHGDPTTHAHEIGHGAFGLKDEYHDASGRAPDRDSPQSPGVRTDGSLMGDYWQSTSQGPIADPAAGLKARHLAEIAAQLAVAPVGGSGSALGVLRAFLSRLFRHGSDPARSPDEDAASQDRIPGLEHLGDGPEVDAMRTVRNHRAAGIVGEEGGAVSAEHHVFPQEHAAWFADRGVDVHDFCIKLGEVEHQAQHGGGDWQLARNSWGEEWNGGIMTRLKMEERTKQSIAGPGARLTRDEIVEVGQQFMSERGVTSPFQRYTRARRTQR